MCRHGRPAGFFAFFKLSTALPRADCVLQLLVPYLYALAQSASRTGLPVIRPLGLEWPNDRRAWASDLELTVGDSLLAAPVTHAGARSRVYLPAGRWIDLFSGKSVGGSRTVIRHNGADDFPLYVRAGSVVPFSFRAPRIWKADWGINDLLRPGRQGWLVAPAAGLSVQSIADRGATLTARSETNGRVELTIAHALREEQILLYPPRPVCRIAVAGSAAPRVSIAQLPAVPTGWAVRRGAAILKVAGASRTLRATLSTCGPR